EPTRRVEARGQLIGDRLIMDKAACVRRADGPIVETHRIELAAFDARDLRADERGAVGEVLRAVLGPLLELAVVGGQGLEMPGALRGGGRIAARGPRERGAQMEFRQLEERL